MNERVVKLMQGNEACAEGAIAAGCRFFAGYPITPSTEIAEQMSLRLPQVGGRFIQMEDEIASMGAIIGGSLTGTKTMTATSGPGFSLKQENIGFAALAEVPCVVVNVQRVGPSTGQPTSPAQGDVMQARWGTHGDHPIIAISPTSVPETFTLTVKAFNLAERFMTPVILLMDEIVGHMREKIEIPSPDEIEIVNRQRPSGPPEEYFPYGVGEDEPAVLAPFGSGYRYHVTGLYHDKTGFPSGRPDVSDYLLRRLHNKIYQHLDEIIMTEEKWMDDAEIAVLAYGGTYRSALAAVKAARQEGIKCGLLKLITIWPFADEVVSRLAQKVKTIIVPELNLGQLRLEVERAAAGRAKVVGINRVDTEPITPAQIVAKIREVK